MDPLTLILIVILVILLVGTAPAWRYSQGFGYGPMSPSACCSWSFSC